MMNVNIYIGLSVGMITFVSRFVCVLISSSPSLFFVVVTSRTVSLFSYLWIE